MGFTINKNFHGEIRIDGGHVFIRKTMGTHMKI